MQQTLVNSVIFKGIGLHSGVPVTMTVHPALANEGVRFIRKDVDDKDNIIPARYDCVEQSQLCTLLKNDDGISVSTTEHVMAALAGCGIDNATLILDGPEVPIMDGSALPFVEKFMEVGIESLQAERQAIRILKPVEVHGQDGAYARFTPDTQSIYEFTIDFPNKLIGHQHMEFVLGAHFAFRDELACSPTFTSLDTIELLRSRGLIKGGSVDNADVYDEAAGVVHRNQKRDRKDHAPVRHKLLDAIGDCALVGHPIIGRFECFKGGHALTNELLRAVMSDVTATVMVTDTLGIAQSIPENMSSTAKLAYNA